MMTPTAHLRIVYRKIPIDSDSWYEKEVLQQRWEELLDGGVIPVRIKATWKDVLIAGREDEI